MFSVTRTTPDGQRKTYEAKTMREAGKHIAYCLHDNARVDRKTAAQVAQMAEKERHAEHAGYTFTIERSPSQ